MPTFPQPGLERRWKKLPGQPDGDAGDPYTGYDRFGRTEAMLWGRPQEGGGFEKLVDVQWGYDRASLKTWRKDLLAPAATNQDQHFGYDGLYQVTQRQKGLLNTNTTAVGGVHAQQEDFGYDETGNWVSYRQANAGELDIDQSRVNNRSNQITQVDGSSAGVSYDKNGNLLTVPTGEALTGPSRKLVWDAWNRLVAVRDAEDNPIASYQYDAATRRTVETTGEGEPAVTRHFYYNDQWRSVEERLDTSTQPERQQVWHPADGYELLLRDRSTGNDGELDERLYPMKDQLDPVALCDATGTVVERYAYSAFGMTSFLNSSFIPQPSSLVAWNYLFHAEFADSQTGWFNYGYRYYLPVLGRWPSRDPIGIGGGLNLYGMIRNNTINTVDLLGLAPPPGAFDGKHPTAKACSADVCCAENISRLFQWITAAETRQNNDFTDYWRKNGDPKKWETHRRHYIEARRNALNCVTILTVQISTGQCVPRPPALADYPDYQRRTSALIADPGPQKVMPPTQPPVPKPPTSRPPPEPTWVMPPSMPYTTQQGGPPPVTPLEGAAVLLGGVAIGVSVGAIPIAGAAGAAGLSPALAW